MKKIIGILMLLMLVAGLFGFTSALAADCAGPVAADCSWDHDNDANTPAKHCVLYVETGTAELGTHCLE